MSRWKPDARGRLEQAAFELFRDRGYEETTVADIAARAELTERTFFRHFTDKREVLFGGSDQLKDELIRAVTEAPAALSPLETVRLAVGSMSAMFRGRREFALERSKIVAAHADVMERELIKRASLTAVLSHGLQQRGVAPFAANLAADMGLAAFHIGFAQWLEDDSGREMEAIVDEAFDQIKGIAAA